MEQSEKTIPEHFGLDEDQFLSKLSELFEAASSSKTTDTDVIRLADIISDDKLESLSLVWCLGKADAQKMVEHVRDVVGELIEGFTSIVEDIEDHEDRDKSFESLMNLLTELKDRL